MNLVLFEDTAFRTLAPLSYSRALCFLRIGAFTVAERAILQFPDWKTHYLCRPYLEAVTAKASGGAPVNSPPKGDCLFLNGTIVVDCAEMTELVEDTPMGTAQVSDGRLVAARIEGEAARGLFKHLLDNLEESLGGGHPSEPIEGWIRKQGLEIKESQIHLATNSWNLVEGTEELLPHDWSVFVARGASAETSVSPAAVFVNRDSVYLAPGVQIEAGAVIDASKGPIMFDRGSRVMSHSVVYGPCYVGENTLIRAGAKIYGPCSFGPVCKLGGEIAESVILGYSNKQHDGFLGHAYVGEWVNMGAGTEVSDLNNNYGTIRTWVDGSIIDSGSMFVGPTIGDHTKTGINTMLNSGTVVGFCCNIFGSDYLPKFVPSFSWGGRQKLVEHDRDKAFETAAKMTARRSVQMGEIERALFAEVYELTRFEREGQIKEQEK